MKSTFLFISSMLVFGSLSAQARSILSENEIKTLQNTGSLVFCEGSARSNTGKTESANRALADATEAVKPKRVSVTSISLNASGNYCLALKVE